MGDTWTINYLPEDGGRLTGKLSVGDDEVRFIALYDSSNKEVIKGILKPIAGLLKAECRAAKPAQQATELRLIRQLRLLIVPLRRVRRLCVRHALWGKRLRARVR